MKKKSVNRLGMIVIDRNDIGKKMCVAYQCEVRGTDFVSAVEDFFEDAGIGVEPEEVDQISEDLFHKGFSTWDSFHFEMLLK